MTCQGINGVLIGEIRRKRNENQSEFWKRFGVTQSGGSRYESGRRLPEPTALLVTAWVHGLITDDALNGLRLMINSAPAEV